MARSILARLLGGALALTSASAAQAELLSPRNPQTIAAALEERGWPAKVLTKTGSNPAIETSRDGVKAMVLFMNCNDQHHDCRSIQFYMGFTDAKATSLERLNSINKGMRFGRTYRDDDGDPVLEMDLDMDAEGIPREVFNANLLTWAALMAKFRQQIYAD